MCEELLLNNTNKHNSKKEKGENENKLFLKNLKQKQFAQEKRKPNKFPFLFETAS